MTKTTHTMRATATDPRTRSRFRVPGAVAAAGVLVMFLGPAPSPASAANRSQTAGVLVEQQEYVTFGPADPYSVPSKDPTTIHVGAAGGSESARSFVRLALDRLPAGSQVGTVMLTLYVTQRAEASKNAVYDTYNVNPDQWLMQACVLKDALKEPFEPENPPAEDCQHASALGTRGEGDAWTFDLTALVKVWSAAGNTGAAIMAIPSDDSPAGTWAASFFKARSESEVGYRVPPPALTNRPTKPAPSGPTYYPIPKVIAPQYPYPAPPPVAPPAAPASQPSSGGAVVDTPPPLAAPAAPRAWTWVLPTCLAAAALVLAVSRRPAFAGPKGLPQMLADVRGHPRAYALASVVTIWGLLFATYSFVIEPSKLTASGPGAAGPAASAPDGGAGVTGPGGSATTPSAPGTTTGTGPAGPRVNGGAGSGSGGGSTGPGTYRQLGNMNVFFPAGGGPPIAQLYSGADDTRGIDFQNKRIKLCGHAAMTYGPAFNVDEKDLLVFWKWLNARGGIDGWKFDFDFVDDGYDPGKAVVAAQNCKDSGAFMTLGGIGFDQIPAVRHWAEQNRELYLHHVVTERGSKGLRYSFTGLPSEERMGEMFGHLAVSKFGGKKLGIIWRDSPNWQSGHDLFKHVVRTCGCIELRDEWDLKVTKDQGNYTSEIARLNGQVDAVFIWENALATVEVIKQAQGQQFFPTWLVFPFNLELQALQDNDAAFRQPIFGIAAWDAYTNGYYGGRYAEYRAEIEQFESAYAEHDPDANLAGIGGDLLFLAWEGFEGLADMFRRCLPDCTRNKMAGVMLTYRKKLGGYCEADFTRTDNHHGGWSVNVFSVIRGPNGAPIWDPTRRCVERL